MRSFNEKTIEQRRKEIGIVLKTIMDTNAEKRSEKNQALGDNYIEQFRKLSDITLPYGADDVLKLLPSVQEKDCQEVMKEKYGYEIEYGIGGKREGTN